MIEYFFIQTCNVVKKKGPYVPSNCSNLTPLAPAAQKADWTSQNHEAVHLDIRVKLAVLVEHDESFHSYLPN